MSSDPKKFKRLLLTGAAGTLGRQLTPALQALADELVLSDLPAPLGQLALPAEGLRAVPCDLADAEAVHRLLDGVDAVVHLGGVSVESPFEPILQANILGLFNLYEAARRHGVKRIVYASSNHVTGCYEQGAVILPNDPPRPDGNYGLSKLFGEGLASLYWDRYGIETVCLRIGTATPTPPDRRALSTWISPRDLAQLVTVSLRAPGVGCTVTYGASANTRGWWHCAQAWAHLGYKPQDNAEAYAAQVEHITQPPGSAMDRLQGGSFLGMGPYPDVEGRP